MAAGGVRAQTGGFRRGLPRADEVDCCGAPKRHPLLGVVFAAGDRREVVYIVNTVVSKALPRSERF